MKKILSIIFGLSIALNAFGYRGDTPDECTANGQPAGSYKKTCSSPDDSSIPGGKWIYKSGRIAEHDCRFVAVCIKSATCGKDRISCDITTVTNSMAYTDAEDCGNHLKNDYGELVCE